MKILLPNESVRDGKVLMHFIQNDRYTVAGGGAFFGQVMQSRVMLAGRSIFPMDHFCVSMAPSDSHTLDIVGTAMLIHQAEARCHSYQQGQPDMEGQGFLPYINDATDSLVICPPVLGDPCLNILYFAHDITQDEHYHTEFRAGMVIAGSGIADVAGEQIHLKTGNVFYIPAMEKHRFRTDVSPMIITAYHPFSDFGPTGENHPMINKTKMG